jgi:GT2 family glycosyltransferase
MDPKIPVLGILILNHNGKEWLPPLYESLRDNGYPKSRIYLVDNSSEDGSVESTLEHYPEVNVVSTAENLGYCMAYNLAMPQAFADGCEWVIWANNDIRLEADCLKELARAAQSDSQIGVLGPAFLTWEGDDPSDYMVGNHPYAIPAMKAKSCQPIGVEWVEGSFMMVSRRCVETVGPLDPYLYFYWEEADFCRRARYRGFRVVLVPNAVGRHYAGGWLAGNPHHNHMVNVLQARNYYIYQLANPFQSFLLNLVDAFHLLLVNLRNSRPPAVSRWKFQGRVFAGVLRDIRTIHRKWMRDRRGEHPRFVRDGFSCSSVQVIRSSSRGASI